ncbi:MAG: asparagine synthase B [Spirochaetia bacterium]
MCGIAGCYGKKDVENVKKMMKIQHHRGPDDSGIAEIGNTILGHTRLSIVDVAEGHQPMIANDGKTALVCNGEIYNHQEIRKALGSDLFETGSDSEVILRGYEQKGTEVIHGLDGMFAFAVADGDNIFLGRDPIGIKPLYYGWQEDALYFASELGALTDAGIEDVHEFPAGHYYTNTQGFVKYYTVPEVMENKGADIDKIAEQVRKSVIEAVEKRLLSDPLIHVGSFCSGGLDSSLIAAIAAEKIPSLHTFVVGMQDKNGDIGDDVAASRIVADHIGSTHHELIFTEDDYINALPEVIGQLETYDPSLVRSAVPCYFTCKLASEYVTVVLTGEGADEIFSGYQYMKRFTGKSISDEGRKLLSTLHNINLQRADRMGMLFSLELRVPFLDEALMDLAMEIPGYMKIKDNGSSKIEKWILRKAFEGTGLLPDDVLWRYKVQYTQGAGCESLGETLANRELSDSQLRSLQKRFPDAGLDTKEAAYYFQLFREYHPQESILGSIGLWHGFSFSEEREKVRGSMDGLSHS